MSPETTNWLEEKVSISTAAMQKLLDDVTTLSPTDKILANFLQERLGDLLVSDALCNLIKNSSDNPVEITSTALAMMLAAVTAIKS